MARRTIDIRLDPNRCNRCGACERVCEPGAIKVGPSYIFIDSQTCTECYRCIEACDRGAILRRGSEKSKPAKRVAAAPRGDRPAPATRTTTGWTLAETGAVLAVVLAAFLLKDSILNAPGVQALSSTALVFVRVVVLAVFYGMQIGTLALLVRRRNVGFAEAFRLQRLETPAASKLVSAVLVVLLLVGVRIAGWIYGVVVQALGWDAPARWNSNLTEVFGPNTIGLGLSVLMVVLVAPVVEELVFRGVLLEAFEEHFTWAPLARFGPWPAIAAQAGLFALYHFTAWLLVPTFLLGLATGWLAHTRQSLWPAIALHSLYNLVPVVLAFYLLAAG